MYFTIEKSGCSERLGLVQIRYDLFLEPGEHNYAEHHIVDAAGERDNPFCCHFYQFEPTVTDAEIMAKGAEKLAMAYANWQAGDLSKNRNSSRPFVDRTIHKEVIKPLLDGIEDMLAKGKPFKGDEDAAVVLLAQSSGINAPEAAITKQKNKVKLSRNRCANIIATDFTGR